MERVILQIAVADPPVPRKVIPPPNLQALVEQHGGYWKVPWAQYHAALERWRELNRQPQGAVE